MDRIIFSTLFLITLLFSTHTFARDLGECISAGDLDAYVKREQLTAINGGILDESGNSCANCRWFEKLVKGPKPADKTNAEHFVQTMFVLQGDSFCPMASIQYWKVSKNP